MFCRKAAIVLALVFTTSCNGKMSFKTTPPSEVINNKPTCEGVSGFSQENATITCKSAESSLGRSLIYEFKAESDQCKNFITVEGLQATFGEEGTCRFQVRQCSSKTCSDWSASFELASQGKRCGETVLSHTTQNDLGLTFIGSQYDVLGTISHVQGVCSAKLNTTTQFPNGLKFKGGVFPGTGGTCLNEIAVGSNCQVVFDWTPATTGESSPQLVWGYSDKQKSYSLTSTYENRSVTRKIFGMPRVSSSIWDREPRNAGYNPFARSIAVSGDTMIVGGDGNSTDANGEVYVSGAGAAFVYTRSAGVWTLQQKIVAPVRRENENFGRTVAVSGDFAFIGAPGHSYDANDSNLAIMAGAVFVYKRTGSTWSFFQKIVEMGAGAREQSALFGESVAVSGSTLVVGAVGHKYDEAGANPVTSAGAVFVYTQSSASSPFVFEKKLVAQGTFARTTYSYLGRVVAIDGDTVVAGAPNHTYDSAGGSTLNAAGAAFVFVRTSGVWAQEVKLAGDFGGTTNGRATYNAFGTSVAVSGDLVAIGVPSHAFDAAGGSSVSSAGAVFTYQRSGGIWSHITRVIATGTNARVGGSSFGVSVSLSGSLLAVGAYGHGNDETGANPVSAAGSAFVYLFSSGTWSLEQKLVALGTNARETSDGFGSTVALDSNTLAVNSLNHTKDVAGANSVPYAGAAFVYTRSVTTWTQQGKVVGTPAKVNFISQKGFGYGIAVDNDTMVLGSHYGLVYTATQSYDSGAAFVFVRSGDQWSFQQKIQIPDTFIKGNLYCSGGDVYSSGPGVALSGDTIVMGCPNDSTDEAGATPRTEAGAAYVFVRSNGTWTFQQKLIASGGLNPRMGSEKFGHTVVIKGDTIAIGARHSHYDIAGTVVASSGNVYVYKRTGTTWALEARLNPVGTNAHLANGGFGSSLALYGDELAVGSLNGYDATGADLKNFAGAVYTFKRTGTTWNQTQKIVATGANNRNVSDYFGSYYNGNGIAMNDKILVVASGNTYNADGSSNADGGSGAAFVFEKVSGAWTQVQKIVAPGIRSKKLSFGGAIAIENENIILGSTNDATDENDLNDVSGAGAAYAYAKTSSGWQLRKKLIAHGTNSRIANALFGQSVAISKGRVFVGGPGQTSADNEYAVSNAGAYLIWDGLFNP